MILLRIELEKREDDGQKSGEQDECPPCLWII